MSAFETWLDRFFESYFRHRPVNATFIGRHDFDDRLPDYSSSGVEDALDEMSLLIETLDRLPHESLSIHREIDRRLARGFLEIQDWEYRSGWFHLRNPSWYAGEALFGVFSLLLSEFAPESERLHKAAQRLDLVPRLLAQARRNVRRAPEAFIERALHECKGALAFLEGAPLPRPSVRRAAAAFADFRDSLRAVEPNHDYACGEDAFSLLLRRGHFLELTAHEIREWAKEEIARVRPIVAALRPEGDLEPPRGGHRDRYRQIWDESRAFASKNKLVTWPDYPIEFVPRPSWAEHAASYLYFLFYRSPAPFDGLARVKYFVPPGEHTPDESTIKLNHIIHHGGIGHHVQNWHANRAASRIGRVAAVDCASRLAMFCGGTMAEGWACYATDVMNEAGFLTPAERDSENRARLRRAARAVVDVEIHCERASLETAQRLYLETTHMTEDAARAEATKNAMFPGTALMYFVGSMLIHRLRTEMERRTGNGFDLCHFHDTFLSHGSIPVALVSEAMQTSKP